MQPLPPSCLFPVSSDQTPCHPLFPQSNGPTELLCNNPPPPLPCFPYPVLVTVEKAYILSSRISNCHTSHPPILSKLLEQRPLLRHRCHSPAPQSAQPISLVRWIDANWPTTDDRSSYTSILTPGTLPSGPSIHPNTQGHTPCRLCPRPFAKGVLYHHNQLV